MTLLYNIQKEQNLLKILIVLHMTCTSEIIGHNSTLYSTQIYFETPHSQPTYFLVQDSLLELSYLQSPDSICAVQHLLILILLNKHVYFILH